MAQPILTRESDGLRFEPTVQPGMVRCECCLGLVEPAQVREHKCGFWFDNPEIVRALHDSFAPNRLLRGSGTER